MFCSSIHFAANDRISFFFRAEWHLIVCMHHTVFIHSFVDRHLGWLCILANVNSGTQKTNTCTEGICLLCWFHFLWIYTQEWDSWIVRTLLRVRKSESLVMPWIPVYWVQIRIVTGKLGYVIISWSKVESGLVRKWKIWCSLSYTHMHIHPPFNFILEHTFYILFQI
jgi:hypothetical protein